LQKQTPWKWKIEAHTNWFQWNVKELWHYKDLLNRFVRRDLIANYQQTVLGPFWIFVQPVLTTIVYWVIFSKIARISTGGMPPVLFYLPGIIVRCRQAFILYFFAAPFDITAGRLQLRSRAYYQCHYRKVP